MAEPLKAGSTKRGSPFRDRWQHGVPCAIISCAAVGGLQGCTALADDDAPAPSQIVRLTPLPQGAKALAGYSVPQKIELTKLKPEAIAKIPADLTAPLYGALPIALPAQSGDNAPSVLVIVDGVDGDAARLLVDCNGNRDLTDDPVAYWVPQEIKTSTGDAFQQYNAEAALEFGEGAHPFPAHLVFYRFDKRDPDRAKFRNTLFYYRDYGLNGPVSFDGHTFNGLLVDDAVTGDFRGKADPRNSGVRLLLDLNTNGTFEVRGEGFDVRRPFTVAGKTYEIADMAVDGSTFRIVPSSKAVEPPAATARTGGDLQVGKPIAAFKATTMDGKEIDFPAAYQGKIVMLDFWATWCGPCMREVPGLSQAYETFHDKGFEVLGVTLDHENAESKINSCLEKNKMPWPQIYDGQGWSARLAQFFTVRSIPAAYLVDGDTGVILADGMSLRGSSLDTTIQDALAKKFGSNK